MNKIYTGIGSRLTPSHVCDCMRGIAEILAGKGYLLRSGGAKGQKEIWRPYDVANDRAAFNMLNRVIEGLNKEQGSSININSMRTYVRDLLARNMYQVMGKDLETPSDFVLCWTLKGHKVGGTRYAITLAEMNNIPICNLGSEDDIGAIINEIKKERPFYEV